MHKSLIALSAALCATTTQAFDVTDVPLFIAGLLTGFVEMEDLTEIKMCI